MPQVAEQPTSLSSLQVLMSFLIAFVGGSVSILLREVIEWARKPIFQLSLDLSALNKVFVIEPRSMKDLTGNTQKVLTLKNGTGKYVRVKVHNNGSRTAHHCEAKIELMDQQGNPLPIDPSILHWVRRTPYVYKRTEDQFAPVSINSKDHEFLDVIAIERWPVPGVTFVYTYSHRPQLLLGGVNYKIKVTVFGENTEPKSMTIELSGWDGTFDGFSEKCLRVIKS